MKITVKILTALALLVLSCTETGKGSASENMDAAEQNKALLSHIYTEVFVNWNRELVQEVLDPGFRSHDWPKDSRTGVEGFYDFYDPVLQTFPDTHYLVNDLIAEDDKVTVYWSLIGTQKGEFMGMPPTNKEIRMDGIAIYRVEKGKLMERWVVYDLFAMVEQIKAASSAGQGQPQ